MLGEAMKNTTATALIGSGLIAAAIVGAAVLIGVNKVGPAPAPAPAAPASEPDKSELIRVSTPKPGDAISNPLRIEGQARGSWYFESSFPVRLLDAEGNVIASGHADAQGDWMTTEFVPFAAKLDFSAPASPTGTLILKKDNPSGLPEHDDQLMVPVRFSP